jgi:hypothetical protein
VNRDIFFEEEKQAKIEAQKKENEERKKKALEDAKKDSGAADVQDLQESFSNAVHPSEGAIRDA